MNRRGPRIAVVALVVLAFGVAAWRLWETDRQRAASEAAFHAFETGARAAVVALADLRAAQQAYVAAGQGSEYWTSRAASLYAAAGTKIGEIRRHAASREAAAALDGAVDLLDAFGTTDEQAREYVAREQKLLASDLVFGDGAEAATAAAARIEEAQSWEGSARRQQQARLRLEQILMVALAAAIAAGGLLLLLPRAQGETPPAPAEETAPAPAAALHDPLAPVQASQAAEPQPDLAAIATLCTDFSRAGDPSALAGLVERAARLLDASGVIVWMKDPTAPTLQPVLSHGYSDQVLARMGSLSTDADNATAEAYRTGAVRIFKGRGLARGAIATPLVTPAGCAGVLAAEVRTGRETSPTDQAIAAIVAAQLASLVSSSPGAS